MRRSMWASIIMLAGLITSLSACAHHRPLLDLNAVDRETGQVLPVYWDGGQAFVPGTPGHRYSIRLRNLSGERLLAVVSVDGVNVLSGQTANPDQGGYVLAPWQSMDIDGWRKSLDQVASFEFTALGDSYAARTGRPQNVGVIGVAVFRERQAWRRFPQVAPSAPWDARHKSSRSESEPPAPAAASKQRAESRADRSAYDQTGALARAPEAGEPLGTGHGQIERDSARRVSFTRASSQPDQLISLRYDSERNLIALGVVPTRLWPQRQNPNPFPLGFVPDPPPRWR